MAESQIGNTFHLPDMADQAIALCLNHEWSAAFSPAASLEEWAGTLYALELSCRHVRQAATRVVPHLTRGDLTRGKGTACGASDSQLAAWISLGYLVKWERTGLLWRPFGLLVRFAEMTPPTTVRRYMRRLPLVEREEFKQMLESVQASACQSPTRCKVRVLTALVWLAVVKPQPIQWMSMMEAAPPALAGPVLNLVARILLETSFVDVGAMVLDCYQRHVEPNVSKDVARADSGRLICMLGLVMIQFPQNTAAPVARRKLLALGGRCGGHADCQCS